MSDEMTTYRPPFVDERKQEIKDACDGLERDLLDPADDLLSEHGQNNLRLIINVARETIKE